MVKVIYNDQLVYKVIIWAFFGITLWREKVALIVVHIICIIVQCAGNDVNNVCGDNFNEEMYIFYLWEARKHYQRSVKQYDLCNKYILKLEEDQGKWYNTGDSS